MMKLTLLISFLFLLALTAKAQTNKATTPPKKVEPKFLVTPLTKKAKRIVIGQNGTPAAAQVGRDLVELAKKDNVISDIVVPRYTAGAIMEEFKKYLKDPMVNFINVPAEDLLWVQDIMQFMHVGKEPFVVDLPYNNREGEHSPSAYALSQKLSYVETFLEPETLTFSNGDFGGNIEAIDEKHVIVGSNVSEKLLKWLRANVKQKLVILDVDWLETGHVDEIVSFIPTRATEKCPGVFLYASTELAHETLLSSKKTAILSGQTNEMDEVQLDALNTVKKCYEYPVLFDKKSDCQKYLNNMKKYGKNIFESVQKLKNIYPSCEKERFIPIPLVIYTLKNEQEDELAFSLNPNPVNGIYLNQFYITSKQKFNPFNEVIEKNLNPWVNYHLIDSDFINALQGGLHCMTNVYRNDD